MFKVIVSGVAALLVGACSDDDGGTATVGGLGLACYPNGTCNVGLECLRGVCVPEADEVTGDVTSEVTPDTTVSQETTADTTVSQETTADTTVAQETTADTANETGPADTTSGDTTPGEIEVTPTTQYYAVIVTDREQFPNHRVGGSNNPCLTSSTRMHGADIDAIGLFDGGDLLGYLDIVDYEEGGICTGADATVATDPDQAKGAPDATIVDGSVSLGGGWLAGEFSDALEILPYYEIEVYESGSGVGGLDEGYEVYLATDLDCAVSEDYPWSSCAIFLGEFEGQARVPGSGE